MEWRNGGMDFFSHPFCLLVCLLTITVQQALRVQWRVFGVFVCFDSYFVNYRSWEAEILQERAEGCIQVDLQKKIRQD